MSSRLRGAAVLSLLVAAAFAAGAGGGFVYAHDPQPDRVTVRVSAPAPPAEEFVAGTIVDVGQRRIAVRTDAGEVTVEIPAGTPIEELAPAGHAEMVVGTAVNLGGNQTPGGPVLTGVVAFAERGTAP